MAGSNKHLVEEYEGVLRQIRDVISARVVRDESDTIQEIHVLASSARNPKQIVRDVESTLLACFNLPIDHKKVSVAQLDWESGAPTKPNRAKLKAINAETDYLHCQYFVILDVAGEQYQGQADGAATSQNQRRLVAEATLRALELYLKNEVAFSIAEMRQLDMNGIQVVVVTVSMVTPYGEETLTGASFIKSDGSGIVEAVLKAVESRLPISTAVSTR
ncbi:MAG: hypothetical protein GX489_04585 [Firmicutes bacterium]|nr:hypothetical protein [Bacillota bacterium]